MKLTLLILAAGMGSRYGGLKQLDPMGPNGETLLDYSLRDAIAAGFDQVVFVIRHDFAEAFQSKIGQRYAHAVEVQYAYQALDDLPDHFQPPPGRHKPWGTAHAIRAARHQITSPFVAINADDYYGADAYLRIAGYLKAGHVSNCGDLAMVGYPLSHTLSPHGTVNRGICRIKNGRLLSVEEHTHIICQDGRISGVNQSGETVALESDSLVSMNFWAFAPTFFDALEDHFTTFLQAHGHEPRAECYIPTVVDTLIHAGQAHCEVLPTSGQWFGVTYPEDKPEVQRRLQALEPVNPA